jgi:hypothetical protein
LGNWETGKLDREAGPNSLISQWPDFPASFYLDARVWAERGSLAAIPAGRRGFEAVLRGAFAENEVWPEGCWAAAFDSMEWLYDPTYVEASRRPPHPAVDFGWQEAASRRSLRSLKGGEAPQTPRSVDFSRIFWYNRGVVQ